MITLSNVSKQYPQELGSKKALALKNLSFTLHPGNTLGLIGANGAGKSTTIRLVMDFIRPTSGEITLFGEKPSSPNVRKRVGYLPEVAAFPANLKITDLIRYTAATCGIGSDLRKKRTEFLLNELGLMEAQKKRLSTYSKGMQQRANFVLALLNDPDLLILDEPMSGLDPIGRGQIISLIETLKKRGKTILFCSHILGDVDRLVDQLLVLHKGETLFLGKPVDFIASEGQHSIEEAYLSHIQQKTDPHYAS